MIDNGEPLRIKRKGEDGYKLISVRIREDTLSALDKMAAETRYSRNELINLILEHGVKNIIIE
jgi:metal-responsive CopG/Arc/MetJ family transcriptional regulator|nr:ribbon-helix-helix protein, CopG family [uncultured Ruminococcus sp.]